ncbi:glycosyltransferase family 2 protein [Candidatus Methylocalor cossyra]|uniref:Glyco_trans_2-like domain-containing protein n=1 Tax=Candidatus Methylocalor cossyra TaxID=3108543 RepID=A0ABP1CC98_9GAMM
MNIKISIIILNWNGKEDTLECLSSVRGIDYPAYDIIVADNGSSDDSVSSIREAYPEVTILENGANLGFAEGNNRAIRYALQHGADAVVLLNNDTIVDSNILRAFCDAYITLPNAGILGATAFYYDRPEIVWAAGANWDYSIHEQRFIGQGLPRSSLPDNKPYEVEFVLGCALFVHREVIDSIGVMDPIFFLEYEDTDWCWRAKKKGYKNYSVPDAILWHKVSSSFGGESPIWKYYMTRNGLLWAKRHLHRDEYICVKHKLIREFIPSFPIPNGRSLKVFYWEITAWLRTLMRHFREPYYMAVLYGVFHYFINEFGGCPPRVMARLQK